MAIPTGLVTPEQTAVLDAVAHEPYLCRNYYFTGGTPLAAFYLHHRLSEDIDLFSEQEVNLLSIRTFLKKIQGSLKIQKFDYRQYLGLHSFQLYFSETNILKVDFNYYPFPRIERGKPYQKTLPVDSPLDIAVNKVHTIAMKPRARDFIDIYFLIHEYHYNIQMLLMHAKAKFDWHIDPLQVGSRFNMASETSDYPRMLKPIDHQEWKNFFIQEAKKLEAEIFQ